MNFMFKIINATNFMKFEVLITILWDPMNLQIKY